MELDFLIDVAKGRNIKAIYDTYIARDLSGGFDFGFSDENVFEMYPHLRPKEPVAPTPRRTRFTFVNKVFSRGKAKKKPIAAPAPAVPTVPSLKVKTLNGQAFGRQGQIDKMLEMGGRGDFSEGTWRETLDDAYNKVSDFLLTDGVVRQFIRSPGFAAALETVVAPMMRFHTTSVQRALPLSPDNAEVFSNDEELNDALVETKMATLLAAYDNPAAQRRMQIAEQSFDTYKATWGIGMEFYTLRNYLSRF
ncbi:MAG: hypothetical protein AAFP16_17340 [Pseudomonadota bacterium]